MDKFNGFDKKEWRKIHLGFRNNVNQPLDKNIFILEKFRRFCSLYRKNLVKECNLRFGNNVVFQLENIFEILVNYSIISKFNKHIHSTPFIDFSNINAAHYCFDALIKLKTNKKHIFEKKLNELSQQLKKRLLQKKQENKNFKIKLDNKFVSDFKYKLENPVFISKDKSIVVFSDGPKCKYALSVVSICEKMKIPIRAIIFKKKFSLFRLFQILNKYNYNVFEYFLSKIDKNNFIKKNKYGYISIQSTKNQLFPYLNNLKDYASENNITVKEFKLIDDVNEFLTKLNPDIGLFASGEVISEDIINCFKVGIINAHKGILPYYKGLNLIESAILENRIDQIGITTHIINDGVDTGPILNFYKVNPLQYKNINSLRDEVSSVIPFMLVIACIDILNRKKLIPQKNLGRQYYPIHKNLMSILKTVYNRYDIKTTNTQISKDLASIMKVLRN